MKQQKLFHEKNKNEYGGSLLVGRRKEARPIDTKKPIHLVLKAIDPFQLLRNKDLAERILVKYSEKMGVKIYETGVHADHVHLAARFPSRAVYRRWIRAVTSVLVQKIKGLKWRLRPYTRISAWGTAFQRLRNYILGNKIEGNFMAEAHARADQFFEKNIRPYFLAGPCQPN